MLSQNRINGSKTVMKHLTNMQQLLHNILEKESIYYTVDGGTLYSLIRINDLLPWDCDFDNVVNESGEQLAKILENYELPSYIIKDIMHFKYDNNDYTNIVFRHLGCLNRVTHLDNNNPVDSFSQIDVITLCDNQHKVNNFVSWATK